MTTLYAACCVDTETQIRVPLPYNVDKAVKKGSRKVRTH